MKTIEIIIKNVLLKILLFFNSVKKNNSPIFLKENSKVLFIRLNKIGDALVTTPFIKLVKENTNCHVAVLADKKNHFVFNDSKIYDEVLILKKGFLGFIEIINRINSKKYDVVVDLHDDISTTVSFLIALLKSKSKIGFEKDNKNIYTNTIKRPNAVSNHVVNRVMEFSKLFNVNYDIENINIHYPICEQSESKVNNYIKDNISENYLVGVNISAGSEARFWGVENFKNIIKLLENYNLKIIILSTENERKYAEEISGGRYNVYSTTDFNEFAAMISKLNFLFTPDTSIVHLASAYKIPMFGIYVKYNTTNMIWSPFKSEFDCVITEEPNFINLKFEQVENKFKIFFERIYEQRNTKV